VLDLVLAGVLLILGGFAVVFASVLTSSRKGEGEARGGGVIMIGPIPIVFGSDAKWASIAIVLAIILVVVSLLFYLV
jgi:uncharacterized protein (TIGR00304 family)